MTNCHHFLKKRLGLVLAWCASMGGAFMPSIAPAEPEEKELEGLVSVRSEYVDESDAQASPTVINGVGFIIKIGQRHFVVTAAHVAKGRPDTLVVEGMENASGIKQKMPLRARMFNSLADVALLELDDAVITTPWSIAVDRSDQPLELSEARHQSWALVAPSTWGSLPPRAMFLNPNWLPVAAQTFIPVLNQDVSRRLFLLGNASYDETQATIRRLCQFAPHSAVELHPVPCQRLRQGLRWGEALDFLFDRIIPGMSGSPIVHAGQSGYDDSSLTGWRTVGIAVSSSRHFLESQVVRIEQIYPLFSAWFDRYRFTPGGIADTEPTEGIELSPFSWSLRSGLLYRMTARSGFELSEVTRLLDRRPTGGPTRVDGGRGSNNSAKTDQLDFDGGLDTDNPSIGSGIEAVFKDRSIRNIIALKTDAGTREGVYRPARLVAADMSVIHSLWCQDGLIRIGYCDPVNEMERTVAGLADTNALLTSSEPVLKVWWNLVHDEVQRVRNNWAKVASFPWILNPMLKWWRESGNPGALAFHGTISQIAPFSALRSSLARMEIMPILESGDLRAITFHLRTEHGPNIKWKLGIHGGLIDCNGNELPFRSTVTVKDHDRDSADVSLQVDRLLFSDGAFALRSPNVSDLTLNGLSTSEGFILRRGSEMWLVKLPHLDRDQLVGF